MRATRFWPLVALVVAALPASAWADARDYPGHLGGGGRSNNFGRPDYGRHYPKRPVYVVPSTVVVAPSDAYSVTPPPAAGSPPPVIYAPPMGYAPPSAPYAAPSTSYAPPPPPPAPPEPRVVEFDSGRYEMRGDGLREPYVWVWIPKAPAAPPGMASRPRPPLPVYRWTDDNGVVTLTDDPNKVPPQFR